MYRTDNGIVFKVGKQYVAAVFGIALDCHIERICRIVGEDNAFRLVAAE